MDWCVYVHKTVYACIVSTNVGYLRRKMKIKLFQLNFGTAITCKTIPV